MRARARAAIYGERTKRILESNYEVVLGGDGRMGDAVFDNKSVPGNRTKLIEMDGVFGFERGSYKNFANKSTNTLGGSPSNKDFWADAWDSLVGASAGLVLEANPNTNSEVPSSEQQIVETATEVNKVFIERDDYFSVPSMINYTDSVFRINGDSVEVTETWNDAGGTWLRETN